MTTRRHVSFNFMEEFTMKNLNHNAILAGLLGAGALLMAATPAVAGQWEGHPDLGDSILNDLDRPAYMGTGLTEVSPRVRVYGASGSPDTQGDAGFAIGAAGPEKGNSDLYGSILFDVNVNAWR
jgi:hypothetical protein